MDVEVVVEVNVEVGRLVVMTMTSSVVEWVVVSFSCVVSSTSICVIGFVVSGLSVVAKCWVVCSNVGNISIVVASNVGSYRF